jgi:hypothetical protein
MREPVTRADILHVVDRMVDNVELASLHDPSPVIQRQLEIWRALSLKLHMEEPQP